MDQEALEILEMVKSGKITPEQGGQLLEALKNPGAAITTAGGARAKFLRIRVDVKSEEKDNVTVNLNLPVGLADVALKLAEGAKIQQGGQTVELGQYLKQLSGMDIAAILQSVKEGAAGKLMDVDVDSPKEKVKVEITVD